MLIAILGFQRHAWPSVDRTRRFYERTLRDQFCVRECASAHDLAAAPPPDAVLNFAGNEGWGLDPRPDCPLAFALHGGPVLDYEFLARQVPRFRDTDIFIVNCRSDEAILRSLVDGGSVRTARLPLPVSPAFRPSDKTWCRSLLPMTADHVMGFVARLVPQKNAHGFLGVLAAVKARIAPRTVAGLVIGDYWLDYPVLPYRTGNYPELLEQAVEMLGLQDDVTFLPASLTDEQLAYCYAAMDVFVHPTYAIDENFGYASVEAMACGTPVVGTAYGGLKDTVVHGTTGYLTPTWVTPTGIRTDLSAVADAVVRLLRDEGLRHRMSAAAAAHAATAFSEALCSRALGDAIRAAIAAWRGGGGTPLRPGPEATGVMGDSIGALPDATPPWEHYLRPVGFYVSHPTPDVRDCGRLQLAGDALIGDGFADLEDLAWPARYRLGDADLRLVAAMAERPGVTLEELLAACPVGSSAATLAQRLQRLVDAGLVVGSGGPND